MHTVSSAGLVALQIEVEPSTSMILAPSHLSDALLSQVNVLVLESQGLPPGDAAAIPEEPVQEIAAAILRMVSAVTKLIK